MTTPGPPLGAETATTPTTAPAPPRPSRRPAPPRPSRRPAPPGRPTRASRRRAVRMSRQRRRRRLLVAGLAVGALVLLMAVLSPVGDGLRGLVPSDGGEAAPPRTASLLLAWPTADGEGAGIVLLGAAPRASRAAALLIPAHTQIEVPSFGSQTFGSTLRAGAGDTLALALENALGYDVGDVVALDSATLTSMWGAAAPFEVRLRSPIRVGEDAFPATPLELSADQAVHLATTVPDGAADLDHLVVIHALLEAWFARLDDDALGGTLEVLRAMSIDETRAGAIVDLLDAIADRDVAFDTLDVESLGVPGEERYALDEAGAAEEMASLFPGFAFTDDAPRLRVEILNGTGRAGLAGDVSRALIPEGARVVLTGNAATFDVEKTVIVLQDPRFEPQARRFAEILGVGDVRMARNPGGVADVSIVVGADYRPGGA